MKRIFCMGSEWLYYKIYTGTQTADFILYEELYPVIERLTADDIISKWFFIRYHDPDMHLRLRFHCETPEKTARVIAALFPVFENLMESDQVWKLQTENYNRELERYGAKNIIASENIFYHDSCMMVKYIGLKPFFENESTQLLFSFLAIDRFLDGFSLDMAAKMKTLEILQQAYKKQFQADKPFKKALAKNYLQLFEGMDVVMASKTSEEYREFFDLVEEKQAATRIFTENIIENPEVPREDFITSHIHMMVNRQYQFAQQKYECLIYDHLYRYYKTAVYRDRAEVF